MRTTISAAGLLLLAGLLTGCGGGGSSAPADASEADFCDAFSGLFSQLTEMDPDDTRAGIRAMKDWAADMEDVGTPDGIPDDARAGFESLLDSIEQIDEDATEEELQDLGEELSEGDTDDQAQGEAFVTYAMKTCPDAMGGLLGDLEDQMGEPSESPSS